MRTRTMKLSEQEYNLLKKARKILVYNGLKSLPTVLRGRIKSFLKEDDLTLGKMVGIVAITLDYSVK